MPPHYRQVLLVFRSFFADALDVHQLLDFCAIAVFDGTRIRSAAAVPMPGRVSEPRRVVVLRFTVATEGVDASARFPGLVLRRSRGGGSEHDAHTQKEPRRSMLSSIYVSSERVSGRRWDPDASRLGRSTSGYGSHGRHRSVLPESRRQPLSAEISRGKRLASADVVVHNEVEVTGRQTVNRGSQLHSERGRRSAELETSHGSTRKLASAERGRA